MNHKVIEVTGVSSNFYKQHCSSSPPPIKMHKQQTTKKDGFSKPVKLSGVSENSKIVTIPLLSSSMAQTVKTSISNCNCRRNGPLEPLRERFPLKARRDVVYEEIPNDVTDEHE